MKFLRFLFSFVTPQVIFKTSSPVSGEITVVQHFGQRSLLVGGLVQSVSPSLAKRRVWGRLVESSVAAAKDKNLAIENILLLGLGGGTLARLFQKEFGTLTIDAVEIDPVVVDVAYRYFDLGKIRNLHTIIGDAGAAVTRPRDFTLSFPRYSVIVIDLYLGTIFPPGAQSPEFLQGILNLLADKGLVVFNRTERDGDFFLLLCNLFAEVKVIEVVAPGGGKNYLFLARKKQ